MADRLRIAVWHHLPSGGGKRALFDQVGVLVRRGHTVEAWCPPTADRTYLPLTSLIPEHELPLGPLTVSRTLSWLARRTGMDTGPVARLSAMAAHAQQFAEALHRGRFDVLFAAPCRWFHVPMVARKAGIPSVLYLQEPTRFLYEAQPQLPWVAEGDADTAADSGFAAVRAILSAGARIHPLRVQVREELRSIQAFDTVLVNSRFSRESVLRAYGVDAKVCYLGIDTTRFLELDRPRQPYVLSVGQLSPHKNPELVIRAVAQSRARPALYWVANEASQDMVTAMAGLARELGVSFELKLKITDEELVGLYNSGMAMLYAPRLEPFGFAPLEANSCGMPVIALPEGGVRETIDDRYNGLLVDDVGEMARAIDYLADRPDVARTLGTQGAKRVRERWTNDESANRLETHLMSAAGRGSSAATRSHADHADRVSHAI